MDFWELFFRLFPYKPIRALGAAYWHVTKRRVRAHNWLRTASADLPFAYAAWIRANEGDLGLGDRLGKTIGGWRTRPRFTVILRYDEGSTFEKIERSSKSITDQIYPFWRMVDGRDARNYAEMDSDYLVHLRVGDSLAPSALFRLAEASQANQRAVILYGDHDELGQFGQRSRPWFKPRWNQEMFFAQDYISFAMAIDLGFVRDTAPNANDLEELVIEASFTQRPVVHVPHILCHVVPRNTDQNARLMLLNRRLEGLGATCTNGPFGTVKVEWPLPPKQPLVTLIVPTKDKVDLLKPCIDSVLSKTDYSNFEILIVDNASVEKRTAEYLALVTNNPKVRVLPYHSAYNFSAINNAAVRDALGTYICMLNNDTEVVNSGWLTEMMRYAVRNDVGAVGGKLLYEDGTIQHAGVVVGVGEAAGHAHRFLPADEPGYFRQPHVAQFVSAVTAACLLVEKKKFVSVGGLDETQFAVAFNDVDFCLKLEKMGWRNVYVPHAVLIHHESRSRGKDSAKRNIDRYKRELAALQERWRTKTYADPLHNPNLDRSSESYILRL